MEFLIEDTGLIYDFINGRIYKQVLKSKTYITCGWVTKEGYHRIKIDGKSFRIHRVLYAKYHNMVIPNDKVIDHINRIKTDNRIENLRMISNTQNSQNTSKQNNNTSGFKNIYWRKQYKKWQVKFQVNGKTIHYGCFENIQDAVKRRDETISELNLQGHIFST